MLFVQHFWNVKGVIAKHWAQLERGSQEWGFFSSPYDIHQSHLQEFILRKYLNK